MVKGGGVSKSRYVKVQRPSHNLRKMKSVFHISRPKEKFSLEFSKFMRLLKIESKEQLSVFAIYPLLLFHKKQN